MYAIELTELTKFKNRTAVDSLSFQINEGEISLCWGRTAQENHHNTDAFLPRSPTSGDAKVMGRSFSAMRRT